MTTPAVPEAGLSATTPGSAGLSGREGISSQAPVVVFDSGIGGLSVLRSLLQVLPDEHFVYLADSAHVPYGDKPQQFIVDRTLAVAAYARDVLRAKAFVIACNTATAAAVEDVRKRWSDWVVVGIEPAVKPAALQTQSGVIGILATSNTLASDRFKALVESFAGDCRVVAQPCPGLVEFIEAGDLDGAAVTGCLKQYVGALKAAGADVIVLGCTHYPFVMGLVQTLAGPGVQVLETGEAVARETRRRLQVAGLLAVQPPAPLSCGAGHAVSGSGNVSLLSTGDAGPLALAARRLLGLSLSADRAAC